MLHIITSSVNPLVKTLKSLHAKKGRAESGLFLAEGARLIAEAADLGIWPAVLMVAREAMEREATRALVARCAGAGAQCVETREAILAQIARRDNPQTMVAAFARLDTDLARLPVRGAGLYLALERVRDPGNLGTILRTADAAGVTATVLLGQTCDPFSVEAVRASMGAVFAAPFAQGELGAFDSWRRGLGLSLIGASLRATQRHDAASAEGGVALLLGNEQSGLTAEAEALCDALVRIPMRGKADSLNLAASAAILTYDFWRRRGYDGADR